MVVQLNFYYIYYAFIVLCTVEQTSVPGATARYNCIIIIIIIIILLLLFIHVHPAD